MQSGNERISEFRASASVSNQLVTKTETERERGGESEGQSREAELRGREVHTHRRGTEKTHNQGHRGRCVGPTS